MSVRLNVITVIQNRYIARNYAAVNAGIFQRFGLVMSQAEFGTLQNACADVLFQLFNSALVNSFSTLRTAANVFPRRVTRYQENQTISEMQSKVHKENPKPWDGVHGKY